MRRRETFRESLHGLKDRCEFGEFFVRALERQQADRQAERIIEDPFDYETEDRLIAAWQSALAGVAVPEFEQMPGYGLAYAGPGTSHVRADTRI